jgi:formate dehydrogenase maturation protein FdhE
MQELKILNRKIDTLYEKNPHQHKYFDKIFNNIDLTHKERVKLKNRLKPLKRRKNKDITKQRKIQWRLDLNRQTVKINSSIEIRYQNLKCKSFLKYIDFEKKKKLGLLNDALQSIYPDLLNIIISYDTRFIF